MRIARNGSERPMTPQDLNPAAPAGPAPRSPEQKPNTAAPRRAAEAPQLSGELRDLKQEIKDHSTGPVFPDLPEPEQEPDVSWEEEPEDGFEEDSEDEEETRRPRRKGCLTGFIIIALFLALLCTGGVMIYRCYSELDGSTTLGQEQDVVVAQGSSVAAIAAQLKEEGIIEYEWLFKYYTKYSGKAGGLQYGTFQLRSGMSYNEILSALSVQKERRQTTMVTFPEGSTAVAIARKVEEAGLCSADEFLACANGWDGSDFSQYDFWNQIPDNGRIMKCEGYLFPDTYEFYTDDTVYNIVNTFYKEFDSRTADLMDTITAKGTTLDDVVNLASFIQEEAGMPEEDARVSACFHNRLESSDPLWADHRLESNASSYIMNDGDNNYLWNSPTAEYMGWVAAGAIPDDILALYDTYRISGLPAGPISNPGYAAIEAALNPDEEYLAEGYYFFVTGHPNTDVAGQYFYAKTANEHYQNCITAGWA